ncbi:MAG: long-chain fatty acid--CoA ligase [Bacteroidales bacterium]|nr:long-chain fatty acid--CoA ligase [Bacteroidales bacterium]
MNFLKIFSDSFQDNWDFPAVTDIASGLTLDYGVLASRMARMHTLMTELGVHPGAKVAIYGDNSIDWATTYMAIVTSGRTAVVLPPFYTLDEVISFAGMVESEYIFIDPALWQPGADFETAPTIKLALSLDGTTLLYEGLGSPEGVKHKIARLDFSFVDRYPHGFQPQNAVAPNLPAESIVSIFFTAGTTGTPKAVMLSADSLEANIIYGMKNGFHPRRTNTLVTVSFGNIWGCVFDLMTSLASGAHVFVTPYNIPTHEVIEALKVARPHKIIISPRLVHSFIHRATRRVDKSPLGKLLKQTTLFNPLYQLLLKHKFRDLLGGKCVEVIICSDAMSPHLEWTLRRAKVNFTSVYGLTECGGIVSYTPAATWRPGTVGRIASALMEARVVPVDIPGLTPGAGELQIHGMTVMKGYFGEDELTRQVVSDDGWLSTGDIAVISAKGVISILGRIDSIIPTDQGPVFPERLELMLITQKGIRSAIVVDRDGVMTAIIEPDYDYFKRHDISRDDTTHIVAHAVNEVNRLTSLRERIVDFEVSEEPLLLTAKGTVRRYEYF